MNKPIFYIALFSVVLFACNNDEKEATARFTKAKALYEQNEYYSAKGEIDSIRILYPKEVGVLKESLELMRLVELKEAERNIIYCDSLIPIKQQEAEELRKGFVLEKDTLYEDIGTYIWKQQTVERNVERSYVRCGVNEKGEMYLASVYFGSRPINHTGIKVSTKGGTFAETVSIPYDGGVNYRFQDSGNTTEVVNYKGEHGVDAIKFIYANAKERVKVDYTGGKAYSINMMDGDKKAVAATFDLATVLSDINTLTTERDKAIKKKAYLENKLNK